MSAGRFFPHPSAAAVFLALVLYPTVALLASRSKSSTFDEPIHLPPGYLSLTLGDQQSIVFTTDDLPRFTAHFPYFPGGLTLERIEEWGTSLIGSPETVAKKAQALIEVARPDSLIGIFGFGGLSHAQVIRSLELFATRVIPALADVGT